MQKLWLPAVRAQLALNKKNPADAMNALPLDSPIEFGLIQFVNNLLAFIQPTLRGRRTLPPDRDEPRPESFKKFSTTADWCGTAGRARWRTLASRVPMHWRRRVKRAPTQMPRGCGPLPLTRLFSTYGRTPNRTYPSIRKPRRSTQNCCSNAIWKHSPLAEEVGNKKIFAGRTVLD
jgi:hypothetical protein